MSNTNYTPGPWHVEPKSGGCVVSAGGDRIITATDGVDHGDADANAELIAAAPDLFAALSELVGAWEEFNAADNFVPSLENCQRLDRAHVQALEAMAKAEGRKS